MMPNTTAELLAVAGDTAAELSKRIAATNALGAAGDASAVAALKSLLGRHVARGEPMKNWDPVAAQRVVELHAIAALHQLGDDSELGRIPTLVRAAERVLRGPYEELRNAVAAIRSIGRVEPVAGIVQLLDDHDSAAAGNAIGVLDELGLPEAPVRQSLAAVPGAAAEVSGVSESLAEELRLVVSAAGPSVALSPGVEKLLASGKPILGRTEHQQAAVAWILQRFLPPLRLDYYVEGNRAVICTFEEAAARWHRWWQERGRGLKSL